MEWYTCLTLIFGGLIVLMVTGLPIAFCFMMVNIIGVFLLFGGEVGLWQLTLSIFSSLTSFTLLPLPLFVLMGEVMYHSGIAPLMIDALDKLLGRLPGRLGLLAVGAGTLFATLTGTSTASVAMLGSVLVPEMERKGYHKPMSLGPILGSGGLAIMIPPSGLAVLLGAVARISIGKILIAILLPGMIMALLYISYIIFRCKFQPSVAPSYEIESLPFKAKFVSAVKYILPIGLIIFLVVGVIFIGVASPTEAAATGCVGTFLLAAAYRKLNREVIRNALTGTLEITVFIFFLIAGASAFSQVIAMSGASRGLIGMITAMEIHPMFILIMMQLVVVFLGMFMECASILMITIPLYMPIVHAMGFDPIWFAILFLLNLEMSVTTPPFGVALFVMKGVAPPNTNMTDIYKAGFPFLMCDVLCMALIMLFPFITLWLPTLMK